MNQRFLKCDVKFRGGGGFVYQYPLCFVLAGLAEDVAAAIEALPPLDRFSHEVERLTSLADAPSGRKYPRNTFVIVADAPGLTPGSLRELFGEHARFFLCTDRADELTEDELAFFEELWPLPMTVSLACYEVKRLQAKVKVEKDAALTRQYLDTLVDMLPDLVWFKDMPGCHLKVNLAFCEAVAKTREDVTGKYHGYIWGIPDDDAAHRRWPLPRRGVPAILKRKSIMPGEGFASSGY